MSRQKSDKKSGSFLSAALGSRLCRLVGACVLVALVAMDMAFVLPSYIYRKSEMLASLETHVRDLVAGALDNRANHDLFDMKEMGETLVRSTPVKGGRITDAIGAELAAFGDAPFMTWQKARMMAHPVEFSMSDKRFEIFLSADAMRLDHGLLLRYDASAEHRAILDDLVKQGAFGLFIAFGVALITMLLLGRLVISPLRSITMAIEHSFNDSGAGEGKISVEGVTGAEMTRLCDAINDLMFIASATAEDGFGGGDSGIEDIPMPMIALSEHGYVTAANADALALFGVDNDVEIAGAIDKGALQIEGHTCTGKQLAEQGAVETTCEVLAGKKRIPCLFSSSEQSRSDGSSRGFTVLLTDVSELVSDMREETERRSELEQKLRAMKLRINDYKQLFDACMILLDSSASDPENGPVSVMSEMLITSWLSEMMGREGVTQNNVRHNSLPPLVGCTSSLRKVFRFALSSVWARSLQEVPVIYVQGSIVDQKSAQFIFREIKESDEQKPLHAADSAEAPVLIAALSRIVAKAKGALIRAHGGKDSDLNELVIRVPLDTETMCTIIADSPPQDMPGVSQLADSEAA